MLSSPGPILVCFLVVGLNFVHVSAIPINSDSDGFWDDGTVRIDPLDGFKRYRGGYDLRNKHYWSSTAFTGVYGFVFAVFWIICGVVFLGVCLIHKFRKTKTKRNSFCLNRCDHLLFISACLCTVIAIVASGLVLGGNSRFNSTASSVIDIISDAANEASVTMHNSTIALIGMRDSVQGIGGGSKAVKLLTSASHELDSRASDIAQQASKNRRIIRKGLEIMYIVTTVVVSSSLVVVAALQVFGFLQVQKAVQMLIAFCWIFAAIFWIFFGIFFFLQNFAIDTCTALQSFKDNPYNNSLSSILPCDSLLMVEPILHNIAGEIYDTINKVNHKISKSYGNIIQICNPFSPPPLHEYEPLQCPNSSITIGEIPRVLAMVACPETKGKPETCKGGVSVPAKYFYSAETYTKSIQRFLDVYPGMERLVQCETAENAFNEILDKHCTPLKRNLRLVCASLVLLSLVLMALVLVWIFGSLHPDRDADTMKDDGFQPKPGSGSDTNM